MNGWLTPMGDVNEIAPHRCGRCSNPFMENRNCPNAPKTPTPVDGFFTDDEAAAILESWSRE